MNVAFLVNKRMSLKFFKDIMNVLLEKNYNVYLLFDYTNDRQKGKWREFPSLDVYQNENKNIIKKIIFNYNQIVNIAKNEKIDYIISLITPVDFGIKKSELFSKWVLIQQGIDTFHYLKNFNEVDYIFFYSEFWKKKCDEENLIKYIKEINCFGNYQFNNEIIFKRDEILDKFNLKDKKVILFLPWGPSNLYAFSSKLTKFFAQNFFCWPNIGDNFFNFKKFIYNFISKFYLTELNILKKIHSYFKKNDFNLIVKSRSKRLINENYINYCDRILYDEQILTPTIHELLYISDIVFTPVSTAVGESIYFHNKTIVMKNELFKDDDGKCFDFFSQDYFNWENLSKIINMNDFDEQSIESIIDFKFSSSQRQKYLSKFYNFNESINVPRKIIESLEKNKS